MKDQFPFFSNARRSMSGLSAGLADTAKRGIALGLAGLMLPLGVGGLAASAQQAPPPPPPPDQSQPAPSQAQPPAADDQAPPPPDQAPPQQWTALSADQLNQLVAPIALYPDSLVAQVLAASTYPTQVSDAERFVQSQQGAAPDQLSQMVNSQPWDPSVKALCAFPSVLDNLNKNIDWTTQLGNAYYNQPQDVMSAVQNDRQQAYDSGKLRSTPQQSVTYAPGDVVIEPVNPNVVYVPYYNPWTVWGWGRPWFAWYAPPPPPGFFMGVGVGFGFGFGIAVRPWGGWGWGWGHWGMGWGPHPWVAYNHVSYVSRSFTVVNHGYYGRFDRNPGARAWNYHAAVTAHTAWHNGYGAGARAGYHAGYNNGSAHTYAHPGQSRPAQNYSRPAQNYNRPGQNANRPAQSYNRPAQNYNRPGQPAHRPAPSANRQAAPASRAAAPRSNGSRPKPQGHR
ncbi:MAG TPA: DUF3300 domain-containing protein [Acidobacteriaceae bacterium]|jgi:hypothetical protein|nr:DUF3300 domain-containing protein [Acidobacteriaceae bacterium]